MVSPYTSRKVSAARPLVPGVRDACSDMWIASCQLVLVRNISIQYSMTGFLLSSGLEFFEIISLCGNFTRFPASSLLEAERRPGQKCLASTSKMLQAPRCPLHLCLPALHPLLVSAPLDTNGIASDDSNYSPYTRPYVRQQDAVSGGSIDLYPSSRRPGDLQVAWADRPSPRGPRADEVQSSDRHPD